MVQNRPILIAIRRKESRWIQVERRTEHETGSCDVLIVDDDDETVKLLLIYLSAKKVSARGIVASQNYMRDILAANPRLILLDVAMPGVNGYRLCSEIKKDVRTKDIQVVLFTAMPMAGVIQGVADSGADGYLLKPFSLADIDRMVSLSKQE